VNFKSLWAFERGEHTSGGSPFYTKAILIVCPLFSLAQEAQEKSLAKKKRHREVSPRAHGDQRSARWIGGRFLKKAT